MRTAALLGIAAWALSARSGQDFKFDPWEAWNSFKEGSSVEFEMETAGRKMVMVKTIDKKEDEKISLKVVTKMDIGGTLTETPSDETVSKPTKDSSAGDGKCPMCGTAYKDHKETGKWEKDVVLKVGDKELKCQVWTAGDKMCNGSDNSAKGMKMWYCKDVPGHLAKMEMPQYKMTVVKFTAK